jgi:hypothetical protein
VRDAVVTDRALNVLLSVRFLRRATRCLAGSLRPTQNELSLSAVHTG